MGRRAVSRVAVVCLLVLSTASAGCVSLTPAELPDAVLDRATGNGWQVDTANSTAVDGGPFSKHAMLAYHDPAEEGRGFPGFLSILSVRGVLSPDREELRERVEERLRENAQAKGLELSSEVDRGERRLANGALTFYVVFNATARSDGSVFASDAEVRVLGEVLRCTGGPTVVVSGSAQVDASQSIGGIETSRDRDPQTWAEIVRDPTGTIDDYSGSDGLVYNLVCP